MRTSSKLSTNREWTTTAFMVGARSLFSCSFRLRETGGGEEGKGGREEGRKGGREGRRGGRRKDGVEEKGVERDKKKDQEERGETEVRRVWSGEKENREGQ